MPLTAQDVAEILRLLEASDFLELRIEHEGLKLTLRRPGARDADTAAAPAVTPTGAVNPVSWPAPESAAQPAGSAMSDPALIEITAPLMGIFYRAPRPGAAPFIEVGSVLKEDTVVGIIEVMKLMNSVRAEVRGTVIEILAEDGAAVEQGQVLVRASRGSSGG